jgi:hypothetical protein
VDREERPDVDKVYMNFVQVSGFFFPFWQLQFLCRIYFCPGNYGSEKDVQTSRYFQKYYDL